VKFTPKDPPRRFEVGHGRRFEMSDCGSMRLDADEQITFVTETGAELDVARKAWGFYATPSLNARLAGFDLRAVLTRNRITDRYFVLLVERGREPSFEAYLAAEQMHVVAWLDSTEALSRLRQRMSEPGA
jgi:hypothetical protein